MDKTRNFTAWLAMWKTNMLVLVCVAVPWVTSLKSNFVYCDQFYHSVVCLSVMFVHCINMAEDINMSSFAYNSPMSLSDLIRLAYIGQLVLSIFFAPQWLPPSCWFECRRKWRAYRKPPSLFQIVPSLTPYDLPFPQNGGPKCSTQDQLRCMCCHLANIDRRYPQDFFCPQAMSPFAKFISLLLLFILHWIL